MASTMSSRSNAAATTAPSTPRLWLEPAGSRRPQLDGGWWPRSKDLVAELPGLVLAIDTLRGPVTRLLLSASGWDRLPQRLQVADRVVRLGYFSSQSASLLTALCEDGNRVDLLILSPDTTLGAAQAAMITAPATGSTHSESSTAGRRLSPSSQAKQRTAEDVWENEGGQLVSGLPTGRVRPHCTEAGSAD
jgi:hypothetical protein